MVSYNEDRNFTDYVHDHLAVPLIYNRLGWSVQNVAQAIAFQRDIEDGIDYHALNHNGETITIQERFRDNFYKDENDFTLRYTREESLSRGQYQSEYFKIKASHMVYGITNGKKFADARSSLTNFIKYIVIDLVALKAYFDSGHIRIPLNNQRKSRVVGVGNEAYVSTVKLRNKDGSSEFIGIDPVHLKEVIGEEIHKVIILQEGFMGE